jgi:hypothetical protein
MPNLTVSANVDTFMESADFADMRTSLGLGALATVTPGTGIADALGLNIGSAGAPVLYNGAGGTPSSLALANATGLPLSTGITGTLAVGNGGTGQTSYTNGQLLIGNTTGNTLAKATLTGTSNQVVVTNGGGSITLSTPQDIATSSTPQFLRLGIGTSATGLVGIAIANTQIASANNQTLIGTDSVTSIINLAGFTGLSVIGFRGVASGATGSVNNSYAFYAESGGGTETNKYAFYAESGAGTIYTAEATEATTGGAGSIVTAGGIHATKKIISATDITALGVVELGNASDTTLSRSSAGVLAVEGVAVPTISSTSTLTNKRITLRVDTLTDAATVTPATDSFDGGNLATLSQTTAFAVPTGTPTDGQRYYIRIESSTARTISWSSSSGGYRGSSDLALPLSTSGGGLVDYLIFAWNATDSKWDLLGKTFGF